MLIPITLFFKHLIYYQLHKTVRVMSMLNKQLFLLQYKSFCYQVLQSNDPLKLLYIRYNRVNEYHIYHPLVDRF
jgi:hypothetical protein